MKKVLKHLFVFVMLLSAFSFALTVGAAEIGLDEYAGKLGLATASETDPRIMAVTIIRWLMTFIGLIATAMILYGGFTWMTAGGNDDKVGDAKKIIKAGVIGLIITLSAFAIITWVAGTSNNLLEGQIQ